MSGETNRDDTTRASVERWLRASIEDAERRGLPDLKPLLEGLAQATVALRAADWNDAAPEPPEPAAT